MTTFTLSAALKKNINARSLIMRERIFQPQWYGVRRCVAHGLCRLGGKLDTMRRGAWQRLASSYPTSGWDVAVANGHCSRTVLPLTPPETYKLAAWEPSVNWDKHFVHRIAHISTRLTCHLGCSSTDGRPSSKFLFSWQNEESDCQKHGRNYRMAHSLPIHHFYHLLFTVNVLFFKVDSDKLPVMFRMKRPLFMSNLVRSVQYF